MASVNVVLTRRYRVCWSAMTLVMIVNLSPVIAVNITTCLSRLDCRWTKGGPFEPTEGSCVEGHANLIDGVSAVAPPGPCNLVVTCRGGPGRNDTEMFQCLEQIAQNADVRSLHIVSCADLELKNGDLDQFADLETFNISWSAIIVMDPEIFYETTKLHTIDIYLDFVGSRILEYPHALIGPHATSSINTSEPLNDGRFLPNLKHLLLQSFRFTSGIPQNAFQNLRSLELLTFGYTNICDRDLQSIRELVNLTHLEIYDSYELYSLPRDFSSSMPNLRYLELASTNISTISNEHFSSFPELETLILGDQLTHLDPQAFEYIPLLKRLSLRGNRELANLPHFDKIKHLETIDISVCSLTSLESAMFTSLSDLRQLELSQNVLKSVPPIFANFPNVSNSVEQIESVDLSMNKIALIKEYTFSNLASLKSIDLHRNLIIHVSSRAFYQLPALSEVKLNGNLIATLDQHAFYGINDLQELNLFGNLLSNFPKLDDVNWGDLGVNSLPKKTFQTDLTSNPLQCDCDMFRDLFTNRGNNDWELSYYHAYVWPGNYYLSNQVYYRQNFLQCQTRFDDLQTIDFMLDHPEKFFSQALRLHECPLPCRCSKECITGRIFAVCTDANLTAIPAALGSTVNVLSVMRNNITELKTASFAHLPGLIEVILSGNSITYIQESTFSGLPELRVLILNQNSLTRIDTASFRISSLYFERLDLSSNYIQDIEEGSLAAMGFLRELGLANNKLETIPNGIFDNLTHLEYLTVSGNPFSCDCDMLYLTDWYTRVALGQERKLQSDIAQIDCVPFSNETELYMWVEEKQLECNPLPTAATITEIIIAERPYNWTGVIVAITCTILLTSLICLLVYRYRLEILVIIYMRTGMKFSRRGTQEEDANKEFDAFLSFSSLDRSFVLEELIPNLESRQNRRKLCIHHRDFIAGECIATNIVNAIENSRRILILCSKNYLQSEWCSYEFKTAHLQALKDRSRRVVLVMMEKLEDKDLDKAIKAYISTNTYLDRNDPLFWSKLLYAIPVSIPKQENDAEINANSDTCTVVTNV